MGDRTADVPVEPDHDEPDRSADVPVEPDRADPRRRLGRIGEQLAARHLQRLGYRVLARNHRTRFGELDLVVYDERVLVFVEVKTRRAPAGAGGPFEAVDRRKQVQVRRMAARWLAEVADRPRGLDLRFDVVGVTVDGAGGLISLEHREGVF